MDQEIQRIIDDLESLERALLETNAPYYVGTLQTNTLRLTKALIILAKRVLAR